jgi:hypothetical protein
MLSGCVPLDNEQITGRSLLNLGALGSVSPNASPDASRRRNQRHRAAAPEHPADGPGKRIPAGSAQLRPQLSVVLARAAALFGAPGKTNEVN